MYVHIHLITATFLLRCLIGFLNDFYILLIVYSIFSKYLMYENRCIILVHNNIFQHTE